MFKKNNYLRSFFKYSKNSLLGFTLIESMIALGVSSVLILGFLSFIKLQAISKIDMNFQADTLSLQTALSSILGTSDGVTVNFGFPSFSILPYMASGATSPDITIITGLFQKTGSSAASTLARGSQILGAAPTLYNTMNIETVQLTQITQSAPWTYNANLTITAKKQGVSYKKTINIPVCFMTNAANVISAGCAQNKLVNCISSYALCGSGNSPNGGEGNGGSYLRCPTGKIAIGGGGSCMTGGSGSVYSMSQSFPVNRPPAPTGVCQPGTTHTNEVSTSVFGNAWWVSCAGFSANRDYWMNPASIYVTCCDAQ
jgi:hypothetical protein